MRWLFYFFRRDRYLNLSIDSFAEVHLIKCRFGVEETGRYRSYVHDMTGNHLAKLYQAHA